MTVPGQIDGHGLLTECLQRRDQPIPAPGAVEAAVDEYKPHEPAPRFPIKIVNAIS